MRWDCGCAAGDLVASLGVGQQQLVEISGALAKKCEVLVLDEPDGGADGSAGDRAAVRENSTTQRREWALAHVSHRMEEIRAISDRITVLRDGKWVATRDTQHVA